jgi:hypothetical protein
MYRGRLPVTTPSLDLLMETIKRIPDRYDSITSWSMHKLYHRLCERTGITIVLRSLRVALVLRLRGRSLERLLEVGDDVVDVFGTDGDADEVLVRVLVSLRMHA